MNFEEIIKERRSIRSFSSRQVTESQVEELIEAARWAPSATNRQPWRFIIIKDHSDKELIADAVTQSFVLLAPVILVCCLDRRVFTRELVSRRIEELVEAGVISREVADLLYVRKMPQTVEEVSTIPPSAYLDMGVAVEHVVLKATSMGLASCWVRMFDAQVLRHALNLPVELEVVALLPLGYPEDTPDPRPRLPMEDLIIKPPSNQHQGP